ncbi:RNase adapter RapZ [candidate division KSB1 bacterium]
MNNTTAMQKPADNSVSKLLIVTGVSGAGKSVVIKSLEDIGFYCVDNLPVILISKFLELTAQTAHKMQRVALGVDIREKAFFDRIPDILDELKHIDIRPEILFMDADTPTLIKRYSETRRKHPLSNGGDLMKSIEDERVLLSPLRNRASHTINTTGLNVHELKARIIGMFARSDAQSQKMGIQLIAFGFRNGLPIQADLVFDTRFLPNPYFEATLKSKTGNDPDVYNFIMNNDNARKYLQRLKNLLLFLIPQFEKEQKSYLTIAIGCTGGQHRSVAFANALRKFLKQKDYLVSIDYRDIP